MSYGIGTLAIAYFDVFAPSKGKSQRNIFHPYFHLLLLKLII